MSFVPTLPDVVSCGCDGPIASPIPSVVVTPAGIVREPGRLQSSTLGYYPLGPFVGRDISGRGNDATPRIDSIDLLEGILCERAEVFDGRQSYALPFDLGEVVSVSIWIRPQKSNLETTVLSIGDNLRFGLSWYLEPIIWINDRLENEVVISAAPIEQLKWHHLVFVRDQGEFRIYRNGEPLALQFEGNSVRIARTNVSIALGPAVISRYRDGGGLHGAAQDVVIRSAALEAHEVAAEYASYCTPLLEVIAA